MPGGTPIHPVSRLTVAAANDRRRRSSRPRGHPTPDRLVGALGRQPPGQLGNGAKLVPGVGAPTSLVPAAVKGPKGVTAIGVGKSHSCAIAAGGVHWCWCSNGGGQFGNSAVKGNTSVAVKGWANDSLTQHERRRHEAGTKHGLDRLLRRCPTGSRRRRASVRSVPLIDRTAG